MNIRPHRDRPTERDIAALADGSLAPARRASVERAVAASSELQAELHDQRYALEAVRAASAQPAPLQLRGSIASARRARRPARRFRAFAVAGTVAASVAAALALMLGGSSAGAPTVADASGLAARPPAAPVPAAAHGAATLSSPREASLRFPYWEEHFGWKAAGYRRDRLGGRATTTVYYRHGRRLVGYTIVSGGPLRLGSPARRSVRDGTELRSLTVGGRRAVTWMRGGHTCVLSGTSTTHAALLRLAAWRGRGEISF